MTRKSAIGIQKVTQQMLRIQQMADAVEQLYLEAREKNDARLLSQAEYMAGLLRDISAEAYEVGETFLDRAA